MTWNYRIMRRNNVYQLHEVYYKDNGDIEGWTLEPIAPLGDNIEDLKINLEQMMQAFNKSVLDYDTLGENFEKKN